jgi:hypothetical protein
MNHFRHAALDENLESMLAQNEMQMNEVNVTPDTTNIIQNEESVLGQEIEEIANAANLAFIQTNHLILAPSESPSYTPNGTTDRD